jgi:hypothetical protein
MAWKWCLNKDNTLVLVWLSFSNPNRLARRRLLSISDGQGDHELESIGALIKVAS